MCKKEGGEGHIRKESGGVSVERKVKCTEKKSKRGMYKKENRQKGGEGHVRKGRWGMYGKEGGGN